MLAQAGGAYDPDPVFEHRLVAAVDVTGAEEALAAHALRRQLFAAITDAAGLGSVAAADCSLVDKVAEQIVALGHALLASADLLTIVLDDAVVEAEGPAAVLAGRR